MYQNRCTLYQNIYMHTQNKPEHFPLGNTITALFQETESKISMIIYNITGLKSNEYIMETLKGTQ